MTIFQTAMIWSSLSQSFQSYHGLCYTSHENLHNSQRRVITLGKTPCIEECNINRYDAHVQDKNSVH